MENSNGNQAETIKANTDDLQRVIRVLHQRASHHRWVGVICVASAHIVLLAAVIPAVVLILDPFINLRHTKDLGELVLNSSVRAFALAIVTYLVTLLTSVYRYNTQLWNHYDTRAWALELAAGGTIPLASAVAALSSTVTFGKDGSLLDGISISASEH